MLPAAAPARQEPGGRSTSMKPTADLREVDQYALVSGQGGYVSFYGRADGLCVFDLALGVGASSGSGANSSRTASPQAPSAAVSTS